MNEIIAGERITACINCKLVVQLEHASLSVVCLARANYFSTYRGYRKVVHVEVVLFAEESITKHLNFLRDNSSQRLERPLGVLK